MKTIPDKTDFLRALSTEEFDRGCIKFNIPDENTPDALNGEGVWGWVTPEDKTRYNDDTYTGKISAILLTRPIACPDLLRWGAECVLQCHGQNRPTLDPEWVKEYLTDDE